MLNLAFLTLGFGLLKGSKHSFFVWLESLGEKYYGNLYFRNRSRSH